jgi:hypothetical protein
LVALGAVLTKFLDYIKDKRQEFRYEYLIKADLRRVNTNLGKAGGTPEPIDPKYNAPYIRDRHHLFGEFNTQVHDLYKEFIDYNSTLEELIKNPRDNYEDIERSRNFMANRIDVFLSKPWLKKIPDDYSDLSKIKFIRYLLGLDAMEEPTKK